MMGPSTYMPNEFSNKQRTQLTNYHNMTEKIDKDIKLEPVTKCYNCIIS